MLGAVHIGQARAGLGFRGIILQDAPIKTAARNSRSLFPPLSSSFRRKQESRARIARYAHIAGPDGPPLPESAILAMTNIRHSCESRNPAQIERGTRTLQGLAGLPLP
ncbi:MAG: hypothetical protein OXU61_03745 [Gammaproteobacteria bacterium]|nr:hypothetical protein [Gammaproteobacteria bacterium]